MLMFHIMQDQQSACKKHQTIISYIVQTSVVLLIYNGTEFLVDHTN